MVDLQTLELIPRAALFVAAGFYTAVYSCRSFDRPRRFLGAGVMVAASAYFFTGPDETARAIAAAALDFALATVLGYLAWRSRQRRT